MRKRLKFKVAAVSALLLSIVLVSFFSANKLVYADENITININEEDLDRELNDDELKGMFPDEKLREVIVRTATHTSLVILKRYQI